MIFPPHEPLSTFLTKYRVWCCAMNAVIVRQLLFHFRKQGLSISVGLIKPMNG